MYADFFGLRELPFNNTPDPRFFYSTPDHEEALASLVYAVQQRKGFVLLTGEVGAGKTLISRMMLRSFETSIAFANINHSLHSAADLMESLCAEFELPVESGMTHTQLMRLLHDFLLAKFAQNIPVVLVLDEAQNLPIAAFEQLRMIGNLEADDAKLLQIAIVGQPELQRLFQSPELRQLKQRIFRTFHLTALDRKSTEGYIRYRLSVAGAKGVDLFGASAIDKVYEVSRGLPRLINTICDNAMLSAYSCDQREIDVSLVESVVTQMMSTGEISEGSVAPHSAVWPAQQAAGQQGFAGAALPYPPAPPPPYPANPYAVGYYPVAQPLPRPLVPATRGALGSAGRPMRRSGSAAALRRSAQLRNEAFGDGKPSGAYRSQLADTSRRIEAIEAKLRKDSQESVSAGTTKSGLHVAVQHAESTLGRVETATKDLAEREVRLRQLSGAVKTVATELIELLDRVQKASRDGRRDQRSAREIHDQLSALTDRSHKVHDALSQGLNRLTQAQMLAGMPATLVKEASVPVTTATPSPKPAHNGSRRREPLQQIISNTRASLTDLRKMVRRTDRMQSGSDKQSAAGAMDEPGSDVTDPANRLAQQLENLIATVANKSNR